LEEFRVKAKNSDAFSYYCEFADIKVKQEDSKKSSIADIKNSIGSFRN
jgi:hypothetical protein